MKILLLEDDFPLGRSLSRVLSDQGHATIWLRDLDHARRHLAVESFDLLLLDIVLPDGSGLDLLQELRARRRTSPVMMLTARDAVSDRVARSGRWGRRLSRQAVRDGGASVAHPGPAASRGESSSVPCGTWED